MTGTGDTARANDWNYLRRWWRVRRSIFLCFFLRMRLRRFLINEPIRVATLSVVARVATRRYRGASTVRGRLTVRQRFLVPRTGVRFLSPEHMSELINGPIRVTEQHR